MRQRFQNLTECFNRKAKLIPQDLTDMYGLDSTAAFVLECMEDKVDAELYELMKTTLLGFSSDMQLEMADNLLDFVCSNVMHSTGIYTADYVLAQLYLCIATGKDIVKREVVEHWLETNNY